MLTAASLLDSAAVSSKKKNKMLITRSYLDAIKVRRSCKPFGNPPLQLPYLLRSRKLEEPNMEAWRVRRK